MLLMMPTRSASTSRVGRWTEVLDRARVRLLFLAGK